MSIYYIYIYLFIILLSGNEVLLPGARLVLTVLVFDHRAATGQCACGFGVKARVGKKIGDKFFLIS